MNEDDMTAGDAPVLLLVGAGPVAGAVARLAAGCGFVVDQALWPGEAPLALAADAQPAGANTGVAPDSGPGAGSAAAARARDAARPDMVPAMPPDMLPDLLPDLLPDTLPGLAPVAGLRRRIPLSGVPGQPGEPDAPGSAGPSAGNARHAARGCLNLAERCGIGRGHLVCIFPPDEASAIASMEEALASHAFYVGLRASREARERIWAALRARGVPDAELAAARCPLGLGGLGGPHAPGDDGSHRAHHGPLGEAVAVVAELLAARAGLLQRFRLED